MVKGAILLVENLPDEVTIETVRSTFSKFGEVKWVDINKSAAQVYIAHCRAASINYTCVIVI